MLPQNAPVCQQKIHNQTFFVFSEIVALFCFKDYNKAYYKWERIMKYSKARIATLLLVTAGILAGGLFLYGMARSGSPIPCLFHKLTGLSCPGCGNTRAVLALLQLDLIGAFSYNLLFPVEFFYLGFVYIRCAVNYLSAGRFTYRSPAPVLDYAILGSLLLWWVIRNILHI